MTNRFFTAFPLLAVVLLVYSTGTANAQMAVSLNGEPEQTIGTKKSYDFDLTVSNTGLSSADFYVNRTLNGLPDHDWQSTICLEELCLAPHVDKSHTESVPPGGSIKVKFTVYTGIADGETGNFSLEFFTTGLSGTKFGSYDLSVHSSEVLTVPVVQSSATPPYPNPATYSVSIPTTLSTSDQLRVYTPAGEWIEVNARRVAGAYRISTAELTPGVYLYQVSNDGAREQGRFVVAR